MKRRLVIVLIAIAMTMGIGAGFAWATTVRSDSVIGGFTVTQHEEFHTNISIPVADVKYFEINCPAEAKAIGGGGVFEDDNGDLLPILGSAPYMNQGRWSMWLDISGKASPIEGRIYVNCLTTV